MLHEAIASGRNHYYSDSDGPFVGAARFGFCLFLLTSIDNKSYEPPNITFDNLFRHLIRANNNFPDLWLWRVVEAENAWLLAWPFVLSCR